MRGLALPYLAELCQPVVELAGCRHLRSAASGKLSVRRTATTIGRRNFAVSGSDIWNSLPTDLSLSSLSTASFARHLKAHLFRSTEWHYACSASDFFEGCAVYKWLYYYYYYYSSITLCASEAAAQCIVIGPVCLWVGVFVGLLPR